MNVGAAQLDITPPVGTQLTGFIARDPISVGVHDPLHAGAIYLDDGAARVLLITCDVLGFSRSFVQTVRREIARGVGLPAGNTMIAASHNHAGPTAMFLQNCGALAREWLRELTIKLVTSARQAFENRQPARVFYDEKRVPGISFNRRSPEVVIDETLHLLRFDSARGEALASLLVFACHPVASGCYNRCLSADFPGELTRLVSEQKGCPVFFANGAGGDINPLRCNYSETSPGFDGVLWTGQQFAKGALALWPHVEEVSPARVRVLRRHLRLPLLPTASREQLQGERKVHQEQIAASSETSSREQQLIARAMLRWTEKMLRRPPELQSHFVTAEVQVLGIGDVALVGIPGELFAAHGLQIKRKVASLRAVPLGYTNGNIGYIPPREEYARGGYEIEAAYKYYGYPAALAPAAGEMVVQTAVELCREMR